jgi:outer membrane lipoprotein LolB
MVSDVAPAARTRRLSAGALLLLGLFAVAGCASLRESAVLPSALPGDWDGRRLALQSWSRFDWHGRVAVASGDDGFSAALRWSQRERRSRVEFDGPMRIGGLRLEFDGGRLADESARADLEQRLGFVLPLESLRYWVLGVPDPTLSFAETPDAGYARLEGLQQAGWTLRFTGYAPVAGGNYELPQRIEATRESVRVRLLVEGWEAEP